MRRLLVLDTHPIQYHSPYYRALASHPELEVEVAYCRRASPGEQADAGFGVEFEWDTGLLEGYPHRFLRNVAARPTIASFGGLDTPDIANMIAAGGYDAVMVNGWHYKSAWQAFFACWRTKTPLMVRSDSNLRTARHPVKSLVKEAAYRAFIPRLNMCLPVGTRSRDYFVHYGARPERITIMPHTIDEEWFTAQTKRWAAARAELRRGWNVGEGAVLFVFAGKFIEKKRPLDFVQAVKRAAQNDARVVGLMVGDGILLATCERAARENDAPMRFTGFMNQSEMVKAYVAADALVLPSDARETWGLVVNEALACGRPCIVSDQVGCAPDLVEDGKTGWVYPMGDVEALAERMCQYARCRPERNELRSLLPPHARMECAVERTLLALGRVAAPQRANDHRN